MSFKMQQLATLFFAQEINSQIVTYHLKRIHPIIKEIEQCHCDICVHDNLSFHWGATKQQSEILINVVIATEPFKGVSVVFKSCKDRIKSSKTVAEQHPLKI
jgi:hypothetical protein